MTSAPFTADQVNSINAYQLSETGPLFTCRRDECRRMIRMPLVAYPDGLHCRALDSCEYTQYWVAPWMADWSWSPDRNAYGRLRAVLHQHYLTQITCDHERKMDNPVCACSLVNLGWHPSVGDAVGAWITHVIGELAAS